MILPVKEDGLVKEDGTAAPSRLAKPPLLAKLREPSVLVEDTTVAVPSTALQAEGARQILNAPPNVLRYSRLLTRILRISGVPFRIGRPFGRYSKRFILAPLPRECTTVIWGMREVFPTPI
ncbi:hypothetical protein RLEG12_07325 (plasmid) [Rhizobium leguminosarum bv. trifolii CB782]|nr:hypothetical protein RLEG12_07325 [Rhizobium leguminosarum bv. trifolii CB782]